MFQILLWPFKLVWGIISIVFGFVTGLLGTIFGFIGGIFGLVGSVLGLFVGGAVFVLGVMGVFVIIRMIINALRD